MPREAPECTNVIGKHTTIKKENGVKVLPPDIFILIFNNYDLKNQKGYIFFVRISNFEHAPHLHGFYYKIFY